MADRVGVFVDISNLYYCVSKKYKAKVDYKKYLDIAVGNNVLYRAYAYGAQLTDEAEKFLKCMRSFGYDMRYKKPKEFENPEWHIDLSSIETLINNHGNSNLLAIETLDILKKLLKSKRDIRKADWDVGLAIDVVRIVERVDTIVLGSADSDLAPLVEWVKDQGCRCIVFACNISKELREVADEVFEIDTSMVGL